MNIQVEKSLGNLTLSDLEKLIEVVVKRTLKEEEKTAKNINLLDTFGSWQDIQTEEEIIEQIYNSRK